MVRLRETSAGMPAFRFPDITDLLDHAAKGAVLDTTGLRDCLVVLQVRTDVWQFLGRHQQEAPSLWALARILGEAEDLPRLRAALERAIELDGSIRETATPELHRLTGHAHDLKQRMRCRLEQILHSRRYVDVLQELYFAQREGRYVVPLKAEMQSRIPGIVHDVSASGATVFVEPRELVDLNNAVKVADLEVEREVRRILRELSAMVGEHAQAMLMQIRVLAELDCIQAKAVLSRELMAHPVTLNEQDRILLKQARHPLLMLSRPHVVANDIVFDESVRALIISGPNTGGKTVTLKILGLFAFMVRAGLHLPCEPESEMAVFPAVYADIGDAQDLTKDLSSFSAHITRMVDLLSEVERGPSSSVPVRRAARGLVLLDEPVTSTDPVEGAALADALLRHLVALGLKVVATTHYNALKALAHQTAGFLNASVQFDITTLAPTYRLVMGVPGGSLAIDIAERLAMDRSVLRAARERLGRDDRSLEAMFSDLQQKQRALTHELDRARHARAEAEEASAQARALAASLQASEQEQRKGLKQKLTQQFQRARAEVQANLDALKREQKLTRAKETKQRLAELEAQVQREIVPSGQSVPVEQLRAGDAVELAGLGVTGTLMESAQGKKRVKVKVGEGEILATVASLIRLSEPLSRPAQPAKAGLPVRLSAAASRASDEQPALVVDVRGKTTEEALALILTALDQSLLAGQPLLRIIHGHGTGRLKSAVREHLRDSPYVESFRPGDRAEGGDGVTIVGLR